ncbi:tRNA lysidine(34) synthetase TilS [Raineyella fluvialis]|uniref:tRNA(Ile)-lysidine synthase n=1 Tax=Raineyella fluvialis TaxID=2662261 RepID=A0A5Q2FAV4_9ACTN|nr:tRNA lysidine(34) synthetase TilS [Raineyella fluvialis]QGF23929.1 tRNA lysidine(34) synthetase TilS [Raineyella fluvialis]
MALAVGAYEACRRAGALDRLGAVVVDHALQEGSGTVARAVRDRLTGMGYPAGSVQLRGVVVEADQVRTDGLEAAARNARYAAFCEALVASGAGEVLLGHTRDDQAETVLLGLVRGSGARSLAGIAPRRGPYVRPLLDLTRATLRECCRENDLAWWEDPFNADERFARVRIRHRVLPVLEDAFGGDGSVAAALARTAALARVDADFLDALAEAAEEDVVVGAGELDCAELAFLPEALRSRVVRRWLVRAGAVEPGAVHVGAVCRLVTHWHGQKGVDVPGVHVVRRAGNLSAESAAPGDGPAADV